MDHDVVVVGAGPAGSVAAAALAAAGRDVLLVDRHDFPRDKTCGDGVPPGTVELLQGIGLGERLASEGFYNIHRIRVGSPRGRTWETRFRPRRSGLDFVIAPRVRFDALLRDHAVSRGAVFERAVVTGVIVEGGRVAGVRLRSDGTEREVSARVVVGADGATSVVARGLGVTKAPAARRAVAVRAYVEGLDILPHTAEFYFQRRLAPGYAWIFPLGEGRANVGVIARADHFRAQGTRLVDLLHGFLQSPDVGARSQHTAVSEAKSWQLPLAFSAQSRRAYDGAVLVGDAGGLVDAATGEGIHFAVASALFAAAAVEDALGAGRVDAVMLSSYDRQCEAHLGRLIRRSRRFHRWVAGRPEVMEALFIVANASPPALRAVLNWMSTDFVLQP